MTGVVLGGGTLFLTAWLVAAAAGPDWYACVGAFFSSWLGYAVLGAFSLCLMYHLCNGIRHLFWDAGMGFEIREAYSSGYAVLAATVILTALAWIAGLSMGA
jgi:succinate dehydrogenase / fumarate reductase cytochrome b subunit